MSKPLSERPRGALSRASLMVAAALIGVTVSTAPIAKAANLYWDSDATVTGNNSLTGANLGGSTSNWGTASTWYNASTNTNVTWTDSNNDIAYLYGGTAGSITVSAPITIGGLVFGTAGYSVGATANANTITFGTSSSIILSNVATATLRGSLAGASGATVTLSGGIFGGQTAGTLSLNGTAASQTGYSGATVINNGMTMALSANSVGLQSTSGITLNNGGITLTNASTETALNRVSNTAPITSNGGTITFANTSGTAVYAETIGAVTLSSGLLNIVESTSQASTGSQTLTLAGLSQAASSTGSVAFSALGGLYTTKNMTVVTGATATTAGQIIGPWATVGTTAALQTDYAVYNGSAQVTTAGITAVANDTTFTSTWAAGSNYNISGSYSSAAATTYNINTLRYSGTAAGTITMTGTQVLGTYGILNGVAFSLTVGNTAGTGTVTLPTTSAGNLYVNTGSNAITINANITDNTGALTLVKNGSAGTLTLAGTNTYTGGTVINAGTVSVAALSGFGSSGGIIFNGSGTITATTTTNAFTNSRAITINNGALATYNIGNIGGPTLSGAITGTGGLILQSSTATARTFTLSNTGNTFQGPLVIGGSSTSIITAAVASLADSASANGAIRLGNATQLGTFQWSTTATGALTLNNRQFDLAGTTGGGAIDNSNATAANIITVNTDLSIQGVGNKTLTFQGTNTGNNTFAGKIYDGVSSVISLTKAGAGTWILSGTNTNTGAVSVTAGILGITGNSSGSTSAVTVTSSTYKVSGASGKASTGGITVFSGGVLTVDNTAVSGGPLANRLNSAVTLSGGQLNFNLGGSATAATDTITTLTVANGAGYGNASPSITLAAATSGASSISVNSLARQTGGTLLISGPNLGTGAAGSGITNILVSANDASAEVIGGTGAAGSAAISINPFIIGQDTALSGTNQYGFMTDKVNGSILANGLRSLVLATEYTSTITNGASSANNINLSSLASGLNSGTTVNSLRLDQSAGTFGTDTLTVTSGGILALGTNRISGGTLAFGSNEALIHAIGDLAVNSAVTGSGGLTKSGDGLLTLSGSLSGLSGQVTVGAGRLVISSASSVSITGALSIANRSGAVLDLSGVSSATFSSLASPTTALVPVGGQVLLGSNGTLTVGDANNTNFVGIITGNGNFVKQGSGTLTLAGANIYSGSTTIAATGTLQGGVNSFLPKTTTVTVNGTLNLNDYTLTLAGIGGSGVVTNTSATARAITLGNDIGTVDSTFSGIFNATTAANLTITKQGGGVFTLTNSGTAGTATGAWTITAGTVKLDYSAAGAQTGNIVGAFAPTLGGGTLNVTGRDTATVTQNFGNVTLAAGGSKITMVAGASGITNLSLGTLSPTTAGSALLITAPTTSTTVKTTTTTITATATNGRIVFTGDAGVTYGWANNAGTAATAIGGTFTATALTPGSSTISGTDANNTVLTSSGSNQATALAGSWTTHTLKIDNTNSGSSNSLALGSFNLTLDATQGAILFHGNGTPIAGGPTTTGDFTISGTGTVGSAIATNSDLIIHTFGTGRLLLNAPIAASTGTSTLTKAGSGTLVLGGTNAYTGTTFITGGTLSISAASNIGGTTSSITITDGAKLQVTAPLSTGTHTYSLTGGNATIEVATPNATDVMTINGVISGAGGLTKSGQGILSITATPTYTGPTFVTAGTLQAGIGTSAFGVATPVDVSSGATLDINSQDQTIGSLSGSGTVTNSSSTAKTLTTGGANLSTTFSGSFTNGTSTTGSVLTKVGTGTLTLSGSTSGWTGGTNFSGGVLRLGASNVLNTTGTWYIANAAGSAQLELASNVTQTSATVTFFGSSANTTSQGSILIGSGATLTLGGTLNVTNVGNALGAVISGSGSLALSAARTFDVRNSTSVSGYELTVAVPVTGAYTLTLVGSGNSLFTGNNTYAGLAVSNNSASGLMVFTGDNSGATGNTTLNSGTLLLDYSTSNASKINPTGTLSLLGGSLSLNGNGSAGTSQEVASTTFASGSFATVNMNPGVGQSLVLNLKALTRAAGAGTVRFNLSGTQSLTNGVLTTATNDATTGLLGTGGAWATVAIGGQTNFATASGGFITAITPTTLNDLSTLVVTGAASGNPNLTDSTGYTGTLGGDAALNTLRFNGSGAASVAIPAGCFLRVDSGGILQTSGVGGTTTISGGRLVGNVGSELIFTVDSGSQNLVVSSAISGTTIITKTGPGTLALSGINTSTGAMNIQRGTVTVSGGYAVGDTQNLNFTAQGDGGSFILSSGTETVGNLTGGSNVLDNNGAQHGTSTITIASGATLTVNQSSSSLTYGGVLSGAGTFVKSGAGDLTLGGNSSTTFTGTFVINQGQVRLAGNGDGTGRIGSTAISVNNAGSELRIDHSSNNSPDRIPNGAIITLNNTAPGLGLYFRDTENTASNSETIGAVTLGAGHNVIAVDTTMTTTGRIATLILGNAADVVIGRTNKATTLVVGQNLGSVTYGSVVAANVITRITITNAPTGVNAVVGGAGADGTTNASIFPYMIGQATSGTPALTDVGNSFVKLGASNRLRPLSTATGADAEYIFDAAGFNALAASTSSNVRFTATPGATLTASGASTRTINSLVIDSTSAAVTVTGPAADTLALTSGAFLSTGTAANNTSLTGFTGITTATNNEYIFFVTNNQFTLGSPLTTTAAALTKSGSGAMILNGLTTNAYTGGTFFNQGLIEASALTNLGPSGGLNFYGGGLRWASSTTFDISGRTVTVGAGGATFDTNGNNVTFASAIGNSGAGGVSKNGTGTLTLSGANTFTGASTVNAGRLQLDGGDNRLPSAAGLTLAGSASLQLGGTTVANQTVTELVGLATNSIVGGNAAVSTLTVNQGTSTSYLGYIGGAGTSENSIALVKQGPGTLTLGAVASTFTGGLTIQAGTVSAGNNANTFGANTNIITLGHTSGSADATLYVSPSGSQTLAQPIIVAAGSTGVLAIVDDYGVSGVATFSGPVTVNNNVILSKPGASTGNMVFTGGFSTSSGTGKNITIKNNGSPASGGTILISTTAVNNAGAITNNGIGTAGVTISADIGSSVTDLTQNSPTSAMVLSGANIAFAGALSVQAGSLTISGGATTAPAPTSVSVVNGATLSLANSTAQHFGAITGAITLGGTGTTTLALELGSTSAYDRLTTSGAGTASGNVRFSLSGLSGFGAGTYNLLTSGSGTLNGATYSLSSAPGGYTYTLNPTATQVQLVATAAATGDALYWRGSLNASWSALSGANTNWDLTSGSTSNAGFNPAATNTVYFSNSNAAFTSGSTIATTLDSAYAINALNFTGAPTGVSIVTIASGVGSTASSLTIAPSLSSAGISVGANAGAVTISAPVVLGAAQTWGVDGTGANGSALTISGAITGSSAATLNINNAGGSGIISLSAAAGSNTYSGTTTIGDGSILQGTVAANLSANSAMVVNGTGILRLNGVSNAVPSLAGTGTVQNNHASTAATLTVGAANTSTTFSGALQNGGVATLALLKTGTGSLTLSGTSTNTGNITVNGGTLNISGSWTGNTTATTLIYGGTVASTSVLNVSGNLTLFGHTGSNVSNGVGVYNQTAGTVDVTGNITTATYIASAAGSYGYFNLTGGTFKERNRFAFGVTGNLANPSRSVAYIAGMLDNTAGDWMLNYSNAQITVAQGGTIDRTGAVNPFGLIMNTTTAGGAYGVLNLAGGTVLTTTTSIRFGNSTTAGAGNNNTAIINLAAGTLQVGTAMTTSLPTAGANNAYLNFAGGTLKTSAAITDWIPASSGAITFTANIFGAISNSAVSGAPSFGGGLTFDTNGFDSSLAAVLRGPTGSGVTQSILTVTGGSGYVGAPEVMFTGGTLASGGSPATGYALISGGVVTGIVITSPGDYTSAPTITLTGGGGTGATASLGTLVANSSTGGGLTKTGLGTLTLSGVNTYGGVTTISQGTVVLSAAAATLGSTASGTVVQGGAQLRLTATNFTLNEDLTLTGIGTSTTGAGVGALGMQVNSGVITYNGTITLAGGATLGTFNSNTATMTIVKGIAGTGDLTIRTGAANNGTANWILQGQSTYDGNTIFSTSNALGTVTIKNEIENALPATSALSMNGTAGSGASTVLTYVLNGFNQTVAGLSGSNGTSGSYTYQNTVVGGSATLSTLTVNNAADYSFGGTLGGAGTNENNLALTKSGNGLLTLTGTNTYSGVTRVTGGTLAFSANENLGDSSASNTITLNGGVLRYTGAAGLTSPANRVMTIGVNGGTLDTPQSTGVLTYSGGIASASTGPLTKTGPGMVVIPNTTGWTTGTTNTVTVSEGTLRAGFGTGGISALTVASAGFMDFTNGAAQVLTLGSTANALTLAGGARLAFELGASSSGDRIIVGTGGSALTSGGTITLDFINLGGLGAGTYDLLSDASGSGLLTNGTTYALGIAPSGFNYTINQSGDLVSLTVVNFNPIYWRNGQGGGSWNTLGAGVANWTTDAAGTTDALAIPGTLDTVIFSASSAPLSGTTITTTLDNDFTIDGLQFTAVPSGVTAVTLNQGSAGTLTIAPSSTSSGISVDANAGNIVINAPLVASNASVASQTWSVDGTGANGSSLTLGGSLTIGARIVKTGGGMLTLGGGNSGAGGLTLNAGTLNINSGTALGTGTFTIVAGATIDNTSGSSVNLTGTDPAMNWNGNFTFTGSNALNLGAGALTLGGNVTVTTSASTLTVGGAISSSGTRSLTKAGAGTLVAVGNISIGGNLLVTAGTGTFGGSANTIGGSVTASGTAFTMNGGSTIGAGLSVTAGTVTMNGANTITGSVAVTGGTLTLGGANDISGGVSVTTGTLNLNVANTIASGVTLSSGSLNIGHAQALGVNTFTIAGGTINNTSGAAVTLSNDNVQSWNGSFTFTGTNSLNMGGGAVTLGASPTLTLSANTFTVGGVIDDGAGTFNLTKTGAGTLTLGAANTYGGTTVINQGTVNFNTTQTLSASTNGLTFGSSAGSTNVGTLALASGVSATFGGAFLVQTDSASANTLTIPTGQTVRLNGSVTVGFNSAANSTTKLTAAGGGALTIGAAGQPTNANVQIGNGQTTNISNAATVDLTDLGSFYANLGAGGTFSVGDPTNSGGTAAAGSTLLLAPTSTIIAASITADSPSQVVQTIRLGSGANEFNATTITIGGSVNRGIGILNFNGGSGTLKIRNLAGTGRATMNVQNGNVGSTYASTAGTVDLAGHAADLLLSTLTIGGRSAGTTAGSTGTFTYDTAASGGVGLDATTISVASRTGSTFTTGTVTGTLTIGANATIGTLTMATNSSSVSTTGDAVATVNISGGTNTIGTVTMGVNTVSGATGNGSDTTATLVITGGTTTVSTAFSMGAQNSALNAATTVNNATSTLNISAGSLILSGTTNLTMGSTTLDVNNAASATINLTGTGLLRVGGNITSSFIAGSTVTNTINLSGGTLDMDGGNLGAATTSPVVFNVSSGTLMNAALINTSDGLTKTTTGTLILSGTTNGWTGDTIFAVGGGTIRLASGTAIPNGTGKGNLVTTNGVVDLNGWSETINGLNGSGTVDNLAASTNSTLTVGDSNAASTFNGTLQNTGTGSTLTLSKIGSGALTLATANTYSGGTNLTAGSIQANHNSALGTGTVTVSSTGVRLVVGNGMTIGNAVVIGANSGASGRGIIEADSVVGTSTLSGAVTINNSAAAGGHFAAPTAGSVLVLSGVITSSVAVVQRAGTVRFSGGGTGYTAFTNSQDTTQIGADNGLATTATVTLGSSAAGTLDLNGFNQSLAGIVKGANGATIGNSSTTANSVLTITGTSSWAGVIQDVIGSGTMKTGLTVSGGALTLTSANTYTGGTTITAGAVRAGNASAFGNLATQTLALNGGTLTSDGSTARTFANNVTVGGDINLGATSTYTGALTFSGTVGLGGAVRTLTVNSNVTLAGIVSNGGLTKAGNGTLTLSAVNSFTGATRVSGGTLATSGDGRLATTSGITVDTSTTLSLGGNETIDSLTNSGTVTIASGKTLTTGSTDYILAGIVNGAGGLTKAGNGAVTITGDNAFSGGTTVSAGTVRAGHNNAFGNLAAHALTLNGGTLTSDGSTARTFANNITVGGNITLGAATTYTGDLTFAGSVGLGSTAARTITANSAVTFTGGLTSTNQNLTIGGAGNVTVATTGLNLGSGSLTMSGTGTLLLNVANTFAAATINTGTIKIGNSGSLGVGTINIGANGTLDLNNITVGNTIVMTAGATLTGGQVSASTAPTTGTLAVELTGSQPLQKTDSGRLELTGANTFTGATSVTGGGTIAVADFGNGSTASPLGVTALSDPDKLVIGGGATLEFTGASDVSTARSFTIAGSATIAATGAGALTFNDSSVLKLSGPAPALTLEASSATAVNYFKPTLAVGSPAIETLTIDGTGQWVIGGSANRFKGTASINVDGGSLGFESGSLGTGSDYSGSAIRVSNNTVLVWSGTNTDDISARLNIPAGAKAKLDMGTNVVEFSSAPTVATGGSISVTGGKLKIATAVTSPGLNFTDTTGILAINGTVGNVGLSAGGTLGGSGTVGDVTTSTGSHLSPGNSPGTLTMGDAILAASTILDWQVQDALNADTGYDKIHLTGNLNLTAVTNSSQRIVIKVASLLGNGNGTTLGAPLNFNSPGTAGMMPRTFDFIRVDGAISFASGQDITSVFTFDLNDFVYTNGGTNNYSLWSVSSYDSGGDTYIRITAVPEPSTYGFGLGALALAAAAIRRRRKNQPKV